MSRLDPVQLEFFHREGYLIVPDLFPPAALEPLRAELTELVHREALRLNAEGRLSRLYEEEPFERRLTRLHAEVGEEILKAITGRGGGGHSGRALFELIIHPALLQAVESFIGPEIVGSSVYRIRPKIPGQVRGVVPWHQDSGYFAPHCDQSLVLTCWIPLVDATVETGCLQVLPRAHRQGVFRHHTHGPGGYLVILDPDLPAQNWLDVPVPTGGCLFLTNCTPHRSLPHHADVVRWSLDARYQSAEVPNNAGQLPEDFDPAIPVLKQACYPPEADFVVQSALHPAKVVRRWEDFDQLRQRYEKLRPPSPQRGWVPAPATP